MCPQKTFQVQRYMGYSPARLFHDPAAGRLACSVEQGSHGAPRFAKRPWQQDQCLGSLRSAFGSFVVDPGVTGVIHDVRHPIFQFQTFQCSAPRKPDSKSFSQAAASYRVPEGESEALPCNSLDGRLRHSSPTTCES